MKILVTGGAGFIGSNLSDELIKKGHEVIVIDNLSSGKKANVNSKAIFYELDITDPKLEEVFKKHSPDYVINHAAQISVTNSVANPLNDAKSNILGLINVIENCAKYKVKKIISVSSGGVVYGDPKDLPAKEDYPFDPLSPYGISKMTGEFYIRFYNKIHGLRYTIFRYSNVYGPRQDPHGEAGVIAIFSRLLIEGKQPRIFGSGEQQRDYVYVKDIVGANIMALTKGDGEAFNIATGVPTSVNTLFKNMKEITKYSGAAKYEPERPGELFRNFLDCSKAKKILSWQPKYTLKEGLSETIEWFRKNP
ncbi:MAG: NAD-dependent epimerase/dehydratase family protein [archaeon]